MPRLITFLNQLGPIAQCDEDCYDALQPKQPCPCQGENYNVGLRQAALNTLIRARDWSPNSENYPPEWRNCVATVNPKLALLARQLHLPYDRRPVPLL